MVRKTPSQAKSLVEQTRREAGVLSVTRSSSPRYSFKDFFYKFFYNLKFRIN